MSRTAIRARWTVLPGDPRVTVAEGLTVVVEGNRIVELTREEVVGVDRILSYEQGIVLPGFVNLHNHALNGPVLRGVVDDADRRSTQGSLIYRLLLPLGDLAATLLSDSELRAVYAHALLEIVRSGTTTVLDMWRPQHEVFLDVAREVGLRVFGAPYIMSAAPQGVDGSGAPVYAPETPVERLAAHRSIRERNDGSGGDRIRIVLGPHGVDTCTPETLRAVRAEADRTGALITIHAAQSRAEVDLIRARYGMSPIELLHETGLLGPDLIVAHGVFATDRDLELLRSTGTSLACCPLTFGRGGIPAAFERFRSAGVRTGVGTDGYSFDYLAELRAAGLVSKLSAEMSHVASAAELVTAGTQAGADALRRPDLGRIAVGATADLTVVSLGSAAIQPVLDPLKSLVWYANPSDVRLTMVDGEAVVEDGRVTRLDEREVVRSSAEAVQRLWAAARERGVDLDTPHSTER